MAFNLSAQRAIGAGEFVERPARNLGDDVIECRFEGGGRFAGNGIGQFVESEPDGDLGAIRAIGYPVALEANADDRLTRGFTSMTRYSNELGSRAS